METDTTRLGETSAEVLDGLNDLLQLDHDAIGAYEIAMEKLEDRDAAAMIAGFRRDHERHVRNLNEAILRLGGTPNDEPHATAPLKMALQSLGGVGGDKGLLMAWRTNELQVRTKYDSYASLANRWPADIKRLIDENALDEERHYQWVVGVLGGEGGGGMVNTVREKVGAVAETVREKTRDGLGGVTNRLSGMLDPEGEGTLAPVGAAAMRAREGLSSAGDQAGDYRDQFAERVRQKPAQTLLMAAVTGFVLGRILR